MESSASQERSEPRIPSSCESQSESSSGFLSQVACEVSSRRPSGILLTASRLIARLLLGSAIILISLAVVLFALAAWLLTIPIKRSSRLQALTLIAAELAALMRAEQTRR